MHSCLSNMQLLLIQSIWVVLQDTYAHGQGKLHLRLMSLFSLHITAWKYRLTPGEFFRTALFCDIWEWIQYDMYNSTSYVLNFYCPYLDNLLCLKVDLLDPLYPNIGGFLILQVSPRLRRVPRLRRGIIILYIHPIRHWEPYDKLKGSTYSFLHDTSGSQPLSIAGKSEQRHSPEVTDFLLHTHWLLNRISYGTQILSNWWLWSSVYFIHT